MDVWWSGPYLAAVLLLAAAGGLKVVRPDDAVGALRSVGLPVPRELVRAAAAGEVLLAGAALAVGGRWSAAGVALVYVGFAGFVGVALARGGAVASCGCFGRRDTPPTGLHLGTNLGAAVVAVAAAAGGWPGLLPALAGLPGGGLPLLLLALVSAALAGVALSQLASVGAQLGRAR